MNDHTSDWTDADFIDLRTFCAGVGADALSMLCVWYSESGAYAGDPNASRDKLAHNPNGHASGLCQLMPKTAEGLGWSWIDCRGLETTSPLWHFRRLSVREQLPWVERFYRPFANRLRSFGHIYVATFLPEALTADLSEDTVLSAKGGVRGWAYGANASFDPNHTGVITMRSLEQAIARNCHGPRWDELQERLTGMPSNFAGLSPSTDLRSTFGLQSALSRLGYTVTVDGIVGAETRDAVKAFQAAHQPAAGPIDGIPGPRTRDILEQALAIANG